MVMKRSLRLDTRCCITGVHIFFSALVFHGLLLTAVEAKILVVDTTTNTTSSVIFDFSASFGPRFPSHGLRGRIVYADPPEACTEVQDPPGPREEDIGWVLLIADSWACRFSEQVLTAQVAGYDAAVVHNYEGQEDLEEMYGGKDAKLINIPSSFVGWADGMRLRNEFNFTNRKYYVKILDTDQINYRLYLWPFVIVVAVCLVFMLVFVVAKFVRIHASRSQNRLSSRHLKKIPVKKYKKGAYYDTCAICLDEFEEGEKVRVLPCDHVYHTKCIDPWLTKNKKTCPVCKRRVMPGTDPDDSDSERGDEEGNINFSERVPLLGESSTSSGPAEWPRYSTQTLRTVLLAQARRNSAWDQPAARPSAPQAPSVVDSALGALGGAGISNFFETLGDVETGQHSPSSSSSKDPKKRTEKRRSGENEERRGGGEADGLEQVEEETREERRERRRKKKEKKRRAEELLRRAMVTAAEKAEHDRRRMVNEETHVEAPGAIAGEEAAAEGSPRVPSSDSLAEALGTVSPPNTRSHREEEVGEQFHPVEGDGGSDQQEVPAEQGEDQTDEGGESREETSPELQGEDGSAEDEYNRRAEAYINPSYSESQEVVLPNPGPRHEMDDVI